MHFVLLTDSANCAKVLNKNGHRRSAQMRKRKGVCLLVTVLAVALAATTVLGAVAGGVAGDINADGKVTVFDAQLLTEQSAGVRTLTQEQLLAAGDRTADELVTQILTTPQQADIEISSAEQVYALGRLLSEKNVRDGYVFADTGYNAQDDYALFDIPEEYTNFWAITKYLKSASYSLTEDLELTFRDAENASYFSGIGSSDMPFSGVFYGNGHTVTLKTEKDLEFKYDRNVGSGFFGTTDGAEISDLHIKIGSDILVTGAKKDVFFGGLVGWAQNSNVRSCTVRIENADVGVNYAAADVTANRTYVGALAGFSTRSVYNDCSVVLENACVAAKGTNVTSVETYSIFSVGGMIGFSASGSDNKTNIGSLGNQLYNCSLTSTNTAQQDVLAAYTENSGELAVGGLVGDSHNNFLAKDCTVKITKGNLVAAKTGTSDIGSVFGTQAGGIIGRLEHTGEISGCSVTGDGLQILSSSPNNESSAGGIVGVDVGPWHRDIVTIHDCTFDGSGTSNIQVEVTSTDVIAKEKTVTVGGIVGNGTYIIADCSVKNTTITIYASGIANPAYAGRIVGYMSNNEMWTQGQYFTPRESEVLGCTTENVDIISNYVWIMDY